MSAGIDFKAINRAAGTSGRAIVQQLVPGGMFRRSEYVVRNPRRADNRPGPFKINYRTGAWSDFATRDSGSDYVSFLSYVRGISQGDAARELAGILGISIDQSNGPKTSRERPVGKTPPNPLESHHARCWKYMSRPKS